MTNANINIVVLLYAASAVLFIYSIRGLASPETAVNGNRLGILGMFVAIATTVWIVAPNLELVTVALILAGLILGGLVGGLMATRAPMTKMPQLVGAFNALGGGASLLVAAAAFYAPAGFDLLADNGNFRTRSLIELCVSGFLGAVTVSGSAIAFAKLNGNMSGNPILIPMRHILNLAIFIGIIVLVGLLVASAGQSEWVFWSIVALSLLLGFTLIIPIGGADMPVIISVLNSYSGWAATALGFTLGNLGLIITGTLVGSSGAILSYIMCKGMNRSFFSVVLGGFGGDVAEDAITKVAQSRPFKRGAADDAAFIMKNASKVIIVPGYGMAVAQAQHVLKEMTEKLKDAGVEISFAIHPVAGRMPGHMNVLLAEAQVPYDEVFELEDINPEFAAADVAFVIGANDVTNPAAKTDSSSPIFGMPVLDVEKAGVVLFVKRSLGSGYAGIDNDLFFKENTMMLLSDAKEMVENIVKAL